jgi:hypothetical protein
VAAFGCGDGASMAGDNRGGSCSKDRRQGEVRCTERGQKTLEGSARQGGVVGRGASSGFWRGGAIRSSASDEMQGGREGEVPATHSKQEKGRVGEVAGDDLFKGATVWRQRGGGQAAGGTTH